MHIHRLQIAKKTTTYSVIIMSALLILTAITGQSCNKDESIKNDVVDTYFDIRGTRDIVITGNGYDTIPLIITQPANIHDNIAISFDGLPDKVNYSILKRNDSPSAVVVLEIKSDYAKTGTYTTTLTATNSAGTAKKYDFNITITPHINCDSGITKVMSSVVCCYGEKDSTATGLYQIQSNNSKPNMIEVITPVSSPKAIPIYLDCYTGKLIIPTYQKVSDSVTVTGSGTFTNNSLRFVLYTTKVRDGKEYTYYCTYDILR